MSYTRFKDFVHAVQGGVQVAKSDRVTIHNSRGFHALSAADAPQVPREGVAPAIFPGFHIYTKLDLAPQLTTSANNEDRRKNIRLLADLTLGVRRIVDEGFDGAMLEAQGPVVHGFIPSDDGNFDDPRQAAVEILEFVSAKIRPEAGDDFRKVLVSYCHGPSAFVGSIDAHGDNSIVSLAPAANVPAKVLWGQSDNVPSGSILEVMTDGRFKIYEPGRQRELITNSSRVAKMDEMVALSAKFPEVTVINARNLTIPRPEAPDSPTIDEPQKSFSISIRADMDGFTAQVQHAFRQGRDAAEALALRFHAVMTTARQFCRDQKLVQLPWAGDCFNLLISVDDRVDYESYRRRRIFDVLTDFEGHMKKSFPEVKWAFSCAAGDLQGNQACNTLVSRLDLGRSTLLLATGLPVERTLQGLVRESPSAGAGVIWREDVQSLDPDLRNVIQPSLGGRNYRDFDLAAIRRVQQNAKASAFLIPPPAVYVTTSSPKAAAPSVPTVRNHYFSDE